MEQAATDVSYMQRALLLAVKGTGRVSPNPMVGCVIVKGGQVVGEGFHQRFGTPHAEIHALHEASTHAGDATLYVNLEPCCHTGKTPPCVDAVIAAGIKHVVVSMRDPNPLVSGAGLERLQEAGIAVRAGVCEAEARLLNEAFIKHVVTKKPFVTLKCAISLDGKIATKTGAARWITGSGARNYVHQLRHAVDAIVVGIGTVLQDDPLLTTRLPDGQGINPLRLIVDSTLRLPLSVRVAAVSPECQTLVATTERASEPHCRRLQKRGVEIVRLPSYDDGRVNIEALWHYLGARGVASVLVEGGATLSASLIARRLVDKVQFFIAPKIIGGDGLSVIGPCGVEDMQQAIQLHTMTGQRIDGDYLLQGYLAGTNRAQGVDEAEL
ncbi:MAG: bifunctional diaminohydroxyphosphoribosylaminopyrimidine deaminase/5-amino-6-(5-phosphoribosylamino)uracil reductase RibD [bacterium]|nr:bifunctional diaminohydroxyphosphoribosylaminopyrimidine deaminase/5-amino-6-(5-phosphoribosylamino)uracil reductase RibD [bacterium]